MSYNEQDWLHRTLQFGLGALLGAASGFWTSTSFLDSDIPRWAFIASGALIIGILAAIYGDKFWHSLKDLIRW